jgi:hypothetical protein
VHPKPGQTPQQPLLRPILSSAHSFVAHITLFGKHSYGLCPSSLLPRHELGANGALLRKSETPSHPPGQIPMIGKDMETLYSAPKTGGRLPSVRCCFRAASVGSPSLGLLVIDHNPLMMDRSLSSLFNSSATGMWPRLNVDCPFSPRVLALCMSHGHGQS